MPILNVSIENKIATADDKQIVCNNSDYKVKFTFDEEWAEHDVKTMRVNYNSSYQEVVFTGDEVALPEIPHTASIEIGVYAGNLKTSTPALFIAKKSIKGSDATHAAPAEDVYNQLVSMIEAGMLKGEKGDKGDKGEQGADGKDYVLTEADKEEIASIVENGEILGDIEAALDTIIAIQNELIGGENE